ncbi:hypothetical protein EC968_006605, partial [Mortierella alpina]
MQEALKNLASALESNSKISIAQLNILPADERTLLLDTWNDTAEDYPEYLCLHQLFEQQAERTPDALAVVCEDKSLTYRELNARSNGLARHLIQLGLRTDDLVAICIKRSVEMIVGILAVLKAGGAYVPLDPFFASDRLKDIMSDATPNILLADEASKAALGKSAVSGVVAVDPTLFTDEVEDTPHVVGLSSRNLAYVIYTSGTTGKPKGVMVEHQGVVNLVVSQQQLLNIQPSSRMTQFLSISFDPSVWETFATLSFGGVLHVLQEDVRRDFRQLWSYLQQHRITHAILTPAVIQDCEGLPPLGSMSTLLIGGEALSGALVRKVGKLVPSAAVINEYGPTEASIAALSWTYTEGDLIDGDSVPIGRPLASKRAYVLDEHGLPLPVGVTGELYLGGVGVARGYLNRPDLTSEKFGPDPYSREPGARMYKTGDMAKYHTDGRVICLGRNDDQIKIRGFRVELGEIEARLVEHPIVSEAAVVPLGKGGNMRLVAYVIPRNEVMVEQHGDEAASASLASSLRAHLLKKLPDYMVPSAFVSLSSFPVTTNGKLDRRALPAPSEEDYAREAYEAPQGKVEVALAAIWSELLQVKRISRNDSFFALGGHSLLAMRLINRISALGASVVISTLFAAPNLAALASHVKDQLEQQEQVPDAIIPVSRDGTLPLSFSQQRLWFLAQLDGASDTYHIPVAIRLKGSVDRSALEYALNVLITRHEALRSIFVAINGQPQVRILQPEGGILRTADLCGSTDQDSQLRIMIHKETSEPFDLSKGKLIRTLLIQLQDDEFVFLTTQHHIISDGWSSGIMLRELSQLYTAYCNGEPNPLAPLRIQYPDYAAWQREWLSGDRLKTQSDYWRTALAGSPVLLDLPTDRPRPPQQSFKGDHVSIEFDPQITKALKQLSQQRGVTLFMTILSAWSAVLSRLSGQDDIVIGTPNANRSHPDVEPLIGFFINTVALRIDLSGTPTTRELLERVKRGTIAAYAHQDLPFEQVVEIVQPPRKMDHTPIFQVMLAWENNESGQWDLPGLEVTNQELDYDTAKYDLTLALCETAGGIFGSLQYASSLFDRTSIERHVGYLEAIMRTMTSDVDQPIAFIDMLSSDERNLLLVKWNNTVGNYPDNLCLHQLFELQVERTPDATAVVHEDQSLTYRELNARANQLAHYLIQMGVQPDTLVALCVKRSLAMVIGILAVLKAGGAYVPLDPIYASQRLRDIVQDAAPLCLISDSIGKAALGDFDALLQMKIVKVDKDAAEVHPSTNPHIKGLTSRHLAYIIYTSGTTGKPKGVMVEHQGVVSLVSCRQKHLDIRPTSRMTQFFSISFDPSLLEIFGTLGFGGTLHVLQENVRMDRHLLWDYLVEESITHAILTPAVLQEFDDSSTLGDIHTLLIGGEALSATLARKVRKIVPAGAIINEYGPTETSVAALSWTYEEDHLQERVPIGRPFSNRRVYLLDIHGIPVPLGAVGEIYIGGTGVARGYLNRPELTTEKFLLDPFSSEVGARMYKTGDLGRYLPDGNLICLGRNDHQVKIRGFRIELGEIEARLSEHPLVSEAVVIASGDEGNKRLVAYVIANQVDKMESHCRGTAEHYMIPSAFVHMDAFPLTPNGKLDLRALPEPSDDNYARQAYEPPQGEMETTLAAIWADLLRVKRVSRHDNFFALGGHSLLAVQVISRLHRLGYSVSVRTLFESPALKVLAESIEQHQAIVVPPNPITLGDCRITPEMLPLIDLTQTDIDKIVDRIPGGVDNIQDIYSLSPLQDGILFHHLMNKNGDPYLLFIARAFSNRPALDRYLTTMQQIVDRHDILRTAFVWENISTPAQVVLRTAPLSITDLILDPASGTAIQQLRQRYDPLHYRIDLREAPLLRFVVAQEVDGRWILLELLHHLIGDHSTLEAIELEMKQIQEGLADNLLPPHPYRNLIAQARLGTSQDAHKKFFERMLSDFDTPSLPFGIADVHSNGSKVTEAERMLPQELCARLWCQARRLGVSVASLCHVAWAQVIAKTSGQQRVVFGTVLFGRMHAETSADRAMGLYINTMPFRVDLDVGDVEERVQHTHALLAELLQHEHASLTLAQHCSGVEAGVPLFSSLLNYRHHSSDPESGTSASGAELLDSQERTNYPFDLSIEDFGSALGLTVQVVQPLDPVRVCSYMQEALGNLAIALESNPRMPVTQLEVLSSEERELLTQSERCTFEDESYRVCLHQLFEHKVDQVPDAISIVCGNQSLTYAELNAESNRLAHHLMGLGVRTGFIVALCLERSSSMVVAMLAILKAGAAYLPLDPLYTGDRLKDIVNDATPTVVIVDAVGRKALSELVTAEMTIVDVGGLEGEDISNPVVLGQNSGNLAYMIYTSGSTGKPKGVMVEHRGVASLVHYHSELINVHEGSRMLQFASISFDFSVWEIFLTLCSGATLVLAPSNIRMDRDTLWRYMIQQSVTHATFTPSFLQDGMDLPISMVPLSLILGGEALGPTLLQNLIRQGISVVNDYGPTETSISASTWKCPVDFEGEMVPIGRPVRNSKVYILDSQQQLVPFGAIGELFISGVGVARGYLNKAEQTAERFIKDPFSNDDKARMYRTGDLVRYLPDGNLVYLGRTDHQVKIRGFRIELGEIEARLAEHQMVSEVVVLALGEGASKRLVAYLTADSDRLQEDLEASALPSILRSYLTTRLPEYMIPSAFVRLSVFPLTTNGKLDRRALPAPGDGDLARQTYEAPTGETELKLASIWSELLNVERRLWFLAQLDGASDTYHIPLAIRLKGSVDRSTLECALNVLIMRHEALRSVFVTINGQPQVKILQPEGGILRTEDLRGSTDQDSQLRVMVHKETSEPFDLRKGPLIRTLLIQLQDDEYVFLITQHHIISDGWSSGIMLRELSQVYTVYRNGEPTPLVPLRIQYQDYAAWQREWLSGDRLKTQSDYWRTALAGSPVLLDLPTDRPRPPQQSFKGSHVPIEFDPQITKALKQLSQQHG